MIEFALVFPMLLLLAVSVFDYGYYLEHVNNLTTVVRDGARYAGITSATFPWASACTTPTYYTSGSQEGEYSCPTGTASNNIEAIIQYEAESLTVPEGGLPINNVDCTWTPPGGSPGNTPALNDTPGLPSGGSSCITIAYYSSSNYYATATLCGYYSAKNNLFEVGTASACTVPGNLVQVTIVYDFTKTAPGPGFDIMNSVIGLQATIVAKYTMVVFQ
jgi:hypothetical protein